MPTDEEIIGAFMEPKPEHSRQSRPGFAWWIWNSSHQEWIPGNLTLDALWQVEERLTEEQWWDYEKRLANGHWSNGPASLLFVIKAHIHATAAEKIKALAEVLKA